LTPCATVQMAHSPAKSSSAGVPSPSRSGLGLRPSLDAPGSPLAASASRLTWPGSPASPSASRGAPPSAAHGADGGGQRRFGSRHVPTVAEALVAASEDVESPTMRMRFSGLMKHLKGNSLHEELQKEVLASASPQDFLAGLPPESAAALRSEFERLCAFGEPTNLEALSSAKWIKLLRDIGAVGPDAGEQGPGKIGKELADITFYKVLHDCDHGGQRLKYDMFCKAICLLAVQLQPHMDWEAALTDLVMRILAVAPAQPSPGSPRIGDAPHLPAGYDISADPQMAVILDQFRPVLRTFFRTFCARNLNNFTGAVQGRGKVRASEKTTWKQAMEEMGCSLSTAMSASLSRRVDEDASWSPAKRLHEAPSFPAELTAAHAAAADAGSPLASVQPVMAHADHSGCTAGTGSAGGLAPQAPPMSPLRKASQTRPALGSVASSRMGALPSEVSQRGSPKATLLGNDPYVYAGGSPVIRDRQAFMSFDQAQSFCRELKIVPEFVTRIEMTRIYKAAQGSCASASDGGSLHGFLTKEAFEEMVVQLGLQAYGKPPFCDEYPEPHSRIYAFLSMLAPPSALKANDRHFYGCRSKA